MKLHNPELRCLVVSVAALGMLATTATAKAANINLVPPDQSVAQIPVTQFKSGVPATLPATNGHPAVGSVFAIESYSSRQQEPVSPPPGPQACLNSGVCPSAIGCVNDAVWPSVAQSISWWQSQNQALKGSYAYQVGSTYSHQDAEGWINKCRYSHPQCTALGQGYTGSYTWTGTAWRNTCRYAGRPSCAGVHGAGWTGSFSWNGSTWIGHCRPPPAPPVVHYTMYFYAGRHGHGGGAPSVRTAMTVTKAQFQCLLNAVYRKPGCRGTCWISYHPATQIAPTIAQVDAYDSYTLPAQCGVF